MALEQNLFRIFLLVFSSLAKGLFVYCCGKRRKGAKTVIVPGEKKREGKNFLGYIFGFPLCLDIAFTAGLDNIVAINNCSKMRALNTITLMKPKLLSYHMYFSRTTRTSTFICMPKKRYMFLKISK